MKIVAVLSSTVLNIDGDYRRQEVNLSNYDLTNTPSYVGHPDTASLLLTLGVNLQPKGSLFNGLQVGESYLAFPLMNPNRESGWTQDQVVKSLSELKVILITRLA